MPLIVGADLALNHGALVDETGDVLFTYDKGKGLGSTFLDLLNCAESLVHHTPKGAVLSIDYSSMFANWGRNPRIGALMMVLVTQYAVLSRERKRCEVHLVSPSTVRACLELPAKASKQEVWEKVMMAVPQQVRRRRGRSAEDCVDAWILTLVLTCAMEVM